jgi:RecA/RadA recombinase
VQRASREAAALAARAAEDDCMPIDPMFCAVSDNMRAQFGSDHCMNLDELIQTSGGFPLPSLALAYLLGGDVWPLSRFVELYGGEGSCKSAFLYELVRLVCCYRGVGNIVETENKATGPLFKSIVGKFADAHRKQVHLSPAETLQDSQRIVSGWFNGASAIAEAAAAKARTEPQFRMPFICGIDSLLAAGSEGKLKKIEVDGAAQRSHPEEALLISHFLQGLPKLLRRKPWCLVAINHYKPKKNDRGMIEESVPGGFAPKFYAGTRIRFEKVSEKNTVHHSGAKIRMYCTKTTQGQKKRSINVEMKWRTERHPETGQSTQYTYWDWNKATIEMLLAQEAEFASLWKAINDIVDLHKCSGARIWSRELGIPKDKPVSFAEAGRRLEGRNDLIRSLYPLLMITHYPWFKTGVHFGDYIDKKTCWESDAQVVRWFDNDQHLDFEEFSDALQAEKLRAPAPDTAYDEE